GRGGGGPGGHGRPPAALPAGRRIDLTSLAVVRWAGAAGKALSEPLPLRWYDDAIPYDFPECEQNAHATDGVNLRFVARPRWGDFYNLLGEGTGGRLVWTHTQEGNRPSSYAISFPLLPEGPRPERLGPPRPAGGGRPRRAPPT